MVGDLDSLSDSDRKRLDAEWVALNALRDLYQIAGRGSEGSTYQEAIAVGAKLIPALLGPEVSILSRENEPHAARLVREKAAAQTDVEGRAVSPLEIVQDELARLGSLLGGSGADGRKALLREYEKFKRLEEHFGGAKSFTENQIIIHDVYAAALPWPATSAAPIDGGKQYELSSGRLLGIRVLHPDQPEWSTGADLVYELVDPASRTARVVFVQYKLWDGAVLYSSKSRNIEQQLVTLESVVCKGNFCRSIRNEERGSYRFPYCAAFIRPTDRLQKKNSRMVSYGQHVPICHIEGLAERSIEGNMILRRSAIEGTGVAATLFEVLFNNGQLGSVEVPLEDLESLYREHGIFDADDRIILHAREEL